MIGADQALRLMRLEQSIHSPYQFGE